MELKAGLGGQVVSGYSSEIKIQLFSSRPFAGEIEIVDANGFTIVPVQLDEHREKTLWLPVKPEPSRAVRLRLKSNQHVVTEKTLMFEHSRSPLTIISSTVPIDDALDKHHQAGSITPVILSATGLPHVAQAYAGVEALVIDPQSLAILSQDQYRALAYYLAQCNIMLLSGTDANVLERLRNISGCGGRFIQYYKNLSQVTPILLELKTNRPPKIPVAEELLPLQQASFQHQMTSSIALYVGGYLLFFILVMWQIKNTHYLLLLPVVVAAAGDLVWTGEGSHRLISWAETESGDEQSKISSLLLLGGNRAGENSITLATETQLSGFMDGSQQADMRYLPESKRRTLSGFTPLLLPQACHLTSNSRLSPQYSLSLKQGQPEVVYLGNESPMETRLLWRGHSYKLPALSQHDRWQPDISQAQAPASPAEQLLNRHLAYGDPALLLPYSPVQKAVSENTIQTTGWLVIRHKPEGHSSGQLL